MLPQYNETFEKLEIDYRTYEMTPLIYASYSENYDLSKFLIYNGVDINAKNKYGKAVFRLCINLIDKRNNEKSWSEIKFVIARFIEVI